MKKIIYLGSISICVYLLLPALCFGRIYFQDDIDNPNSINTLTLRTTDTNIELMDSEGVNDSKCVRVRYDHHGTKGYWLGINVERLNLSDIYVRFYVKRTSWIEGGCKFLKLMGKRDSPKGYANSTFDLKYTSGILHRVAYGAGFAYDNDGQSHVTFSGWSRDKNVAVVASKGNYTVPDDTWVCFEAHMKYNTNGNRDGEYQVWIDGELWLDAKNVVNRNDANSQYFNSVELANYTQPWSDTWYLWYDNIVISDNYIGPIDKLADNAVSVDLNEEFELQNSDEGGDEECATGRTLFKEDFDDADFISRGWYDNTNIQLSSDAHISVSTGSAEFHFALDAIKPVSGGTMRRKFADTDEVYVSYFVKYSANWEGSNKRYHPHEFYLLTNVDGDWIGPSSTHLTAYIEQNEGVPLLSIQDAQNVDESNIGVDLTHITEKRAVAGCNGDGDCYQAGSVHNNGKQWKADNVYFQDEPGQYYKNDWHFVEAYFKLNSISGGKGVANGQIKYWYDGDLVIDHNNVMMRTAQHPDMKFNQFLIGPYIGDGSPVDQTFWIDNLRVATSRVQGDILPGEAIGLTEEEGLQAAVNTQESELVWLPQGIDLTKHSMGPFTVKVRVDGIDEERYPSIILRIKYYIGTGNSYGYFDMIKEGNGVWRFDILDPNWYRYRSKSLRYHVMVFDGEDNVITESNWQKELIDSFVQDYN